MNDKPRCCKLVMGTGRYASFNKTPCTKPVRVTVDGKHYCAIHDPEAVKRRRAKAQAEADARQEAQNAARKLVLETERKAACFDTLVAALEKAERLCKEALPKFNWGASCLDANAITLLNEAPAHISAALKEAKP